MVTRWLRILPVCWNALRGSRWKLCHLQWSAHQGMGTLSSQKIQHVKTMFIQCWANVVEGGPTLNKHWIDVSCLHGLSSSHGIIPLSLWLSCLRKERQSNKHDTFIQCLFNVSPPYKTLAQHKKKLNRCLASRKNDRPENMRRWTNAALMLAHRLRRWPNIKPTLVQCLMFVGFLLAGTETIDITHVTASFMS